MPQYFAKTQADNPNIAEQILEDFPQHTIFLLHGDLGAGKTTFIKDLCKALGVTETVSSPTFSIVNEYQGLHDRIYHFDFYRIKTEQEVYDLGYEEYFYSGVYCFIEWAEKIPSLIPEHSLSIYITVNDQNERSFDISTQA